MDANAAPKLTRAVARKVLATVDAGLVSGLGNPVPGQMCVEAAVNYALGNDHGDNPSCVGSAVRAFKIRLNDARWPTNKDRTEGMRKLAIAQLGSDEIDQKEFARFVVIETIKRILPMTLRTAASFIPKHKEELELLAVACEAVTDLVSARAAAVKAKEGAYKVRAYAYAAYAAYAADAYAAAAAYAADAYAADAYAADAYADAYAAAYAADDYAAAYADAATKKTFFAKRLEVLRLSAQIGLEALKHCGSKGVKWLDLCE